MAYYFANKHPQTNGDHEVHLTSCQYLPSEQNRLSLGDHLTCQSAVRKAKETYPKADGCKYCAPACHTS